MRNTVTLAVIARPASPTSVSAPVTTEPTDVDPVAQIRPGASASGPVNELGER
jgi:hypothetical protein